MQEARRQLGQSEPYGRLQASGIYRSTAATWQPRAHERKGDYSSALKCWSRAGGELCRITSSIAAEHLCVREEEEALCRGATIRTSLRSTRRAACTTQSLPHRPPRSRSRLPLARMRGKTTCNHSASPWATQRIRTRCDRSALERLARPLAAAARWARSLTSVLAAQHRHAHGQRSVRMACVHGSVACAARAHVEDAPPHLDELAHELVGDPAAELHRRTRRA